MKKVIFVLSCFLISSVMYSQSGAFKIRNDAAMQIGYDHYRFLTFGESHPSTPINNGAWSIEYWDNGLNFWRPWPNWNAGNYYMYIHDFGQVGIGMKPNMWDWTNRLQVKGKVKSHGYNTWSDERLKENILPVDSALERIMRLRPVQYNYKIDAEIYSTDAAQNDEDETKMNTIRGDNFNLNENFTRDVRFGLLAQEVERIIPEIVETGEDSYKAINYVDLVPLLIEAIKEQQREIEELRRMIRE